MAQYAGNVEVDIWRHWVMISGTRGALETEMRTRLKRVCRRKAPTGKAP